MTVRSDVSDTNDKEGEAPEAESARMWRWMVAGLVLLLLVTAAWGFGQWQSYRRASNLLEGQRQQAFYDLLSNVEQMQVALAKSEAAGGSAQLISQLGKVANSADAAAQSLSEIPLSHTALINTGSFLRQTADYSRSLVGSVSRGEAVTEKDREQLGQVREHCGSLAESLHQLRDRLQEEEYRWSRLQDARVAVDGIDEDLGLMKMGEIEKDVQDIPGLIYDGPLSEHVVGASPRALTGPEISEERAFASAREVMQSIAEETPSLQKVGEAVGDFSTYTFSCELPQKRYWLDIAKQGGHLVWINSERRNEADRVEAGGGITVEVARERAVSFARQVGYSNMESRFAFSEGDRVVTNLVFKQEDVLIYPDQVKVMVCLRTGDILGLDATSYLMTHTDREILTPDVDAEEAIQRLHPQLDEAGEPRLALIEREDLTEVLCWEISARMGDNEFLVFINAETGEEEDIMHLIETEGGYLTE